MDPLLFRFAVGSRSIYLGRHISRHATIKCHSDVVDRILHVIPGNGHHFQRLPWSLMGLTRPPWTEDKHTLQTTTPTPTHRNKRAVNHMRRRNMATMLRTKPSRMLSVAKSAQVVSKHGQRSWVIFKQPRPRPRPPPLLSRTSFSTHSAPPASKAPTQVLCRTYSSAAGTTGQEGAGGGAAEAADFKSNITPTIQQKVGVNLHMQPNHPINIIKTLVEAYFQERYRSSGSSRSGSGSGCVFSILDNMDPYVSTSACFDSLLVPKSHPSRSKSDTFYKVRSQ